MRFALLILVLLNISGNSQAEPACGNLWNEFKAIETRIEDDASRKSFFDLISIKNWFSKTRAYAAANNQALKSLSEIETPTEIKPGYKSELTMSEINQLFKNVQKHDVAAISSENRKKYDPHGRGIGFCFGRAMTSHLEALWNFKLVNSSVRKLWLVGNVGPWDFHVTTIVKGPEGKWYAIDPTVLRPVTVESWYRQYYAFSKVNGLWRRNVDGKLKFAGGMLLFHTKPKRFSMYADSAPKSVYTGSYVDGKWVDNFNGYFRDLFEYYKTLRENVK